MVLVKEEKQRRAEEALKEEHRHLQAIIDFLPDPTMVIDKTGRVTAWNRAIERMTGVKAEEMIGKGDYEYSLPFYGERRPILVDLALIPDEAFMASHYDEINRQDAVLAGEVFTPETYGGKGAYLWATASRLFDADGNVIGAVESIHDITKRKSLETALRESEEKYRLLVENANSIILRMDTKGNVTFFNDYASRFFGYSHEEIIGRNVIGTILPATDGAGRDLEKMILNIGFHYELYRNNENENICRNGRRVWVAWTNTPVLDDQGRCIEILSIGNDINERKEMEEQLRQVQKMKAIGQLAGGIAHDFNNILMTIIGFSTILKMKLDERDPIQSDIDQILAASDRAAHLTRSMLAYSSKQFMTPKPVDLNDIVRNGEKFLRRVIGEDLEFISTYADEPLKVLADSVQIEQVLMNLATNARDAMPDGGTLAISTESVEIKDHLLDINEFAKKGLYAVLTLSDTGIGMDKSTVDRIFDPFFTTKEVGKGTGLGLSMVYGVVRQHDGFIICYSNPGKGTTFRIYLPIFHGEMGEGPSLQDVQMTQGRETILLAEDDPSSRSLSRRYLEKFGYTVIEATNGEEAVKKYIEQRDKIDLALLDVIMPRLNGREVYRRIKEINPDIKIIFMSGYTDDIIHKEEIVEEGLTVLTKPTMIKELPLIIREVLDS